MINRYRSISRQIAAPTFQSIATAKKVNTFDALVSGNTQIDKYIFVDDTELAREMQKNFAGNCTVKVWSEKADNKRGFVNKAEISYNGHKLFANVYGVENAPVMDKEFSKDETKSLKFGYCKSGNEEVGQVKTNPRTGELEFIHTIYVNLV